MRMLGYALLWGALLALVVVWNAGAHDRQRPGRAYDAIVKCAHMAEDTAAHVRLVRYDHTPEGIVIVYVCEREGY